MRQLMLYILAIICCPQVWAADEPVTLQISNGVTTMSNGLLTVQIGKDGNVSAIITADGEKVIDPGSSATKGYLSYVVIEDGNRRTGELKATKTPKTIVETEDMAEVVYYNEDCDLKWYVGYIMRRGVSGIYVYAYHNNTSATPAGVEEGRFVWRVNPATFNYCWVNDDQQAALPTVSQMKNYVEQLQDATYLLDDGTVYTKYDWAAYNRDDQLHGLMGSNVGIWSIMPSAEWCNGGPDKQDLTVHTTDTTPLILQMFQSQHYGASTAYFAKNKQKLYGPYLVYVNSGDTRNAMIADAKNQAKTEMDAWPYTWFNHTLFPLERASVTGAISLPAGFNTTKLRVVLSQPGSNPLSQGEDYQYWAETDNSGCFTIKHVRPGSYAVFAYALDGDATGWLETESYDIKAGDADLGTIKWQPQQYDGGTLFCIGQADHTTKGFCLSNHARQYGLWNEVPANLTYTVGSSNPETDWYYAQTQEGTWTIRFNSSRTYSEPLHLTIATAGAARDNVKLEVKFNNNAALESIAFKNDAGIYRSAVLGGKDSTIVVEVPAEQILQGSNSLRLKLWNKGTSVGGVMYDLIKLEAGKAVDSTSGIHAIKRSDTDTPVFDLYGRKMPYDHLPKGLYIQKGHKFVVR